MADAGELAREYLECFNRRDFDRARELCDPEYTHRGADGLVQNGPEAAADLMRMWASAFSDARIDIERLCPVSDDAVVLEFKGTGTQDGEFLGIAPTGKKVEVLVCDVLQIRDGKILSEHEYIDMFTVLRQLEAIPELAGV